jgi:predicted KAP-like P-loop ATPase
MADIRLHSDVPAADRDYLDFARYVTPLADILCQPAPNTPLTIGVFGVWGSGKSTVLAQLDRELKKREDGGGQKFVRVHFNAWLHRKEPNMLVPMIHALHDTLAEYPGEKFVESAKKIGNILVRLGAGLFLKTVTADRVSVENLEALETAYAKEKMLVESEMRKLRSKLQEEANQVAADDTRLVFFIDDLDRCEPDQMIDLLDSIKIFLDLENAFFVIAADKEVIDRGVEIKFGKFKFAEDRLPAIGAEYLEKMVQVPFHLLPLFPDQIGKYLTDLDARMEKEQVDFLAKVVEANPRRVKRILNAMSLTRHMARGQLDADVLLRLSILQIQNGEIYWAAAHQPTLLLALEQVYLGNLRVENAGGFAQYQELAKQAQDFCTKHYKAGSSLGTLFEKGPFAKIADKLQTYFTVVGQ